MPSWITHFIIGDRIMDKCPSIDEYAFSAGITAPDCNIQNEDWTSFEPPREVTHFMTGSRKSLSDSDRFFGIYLADNRFKAYDLEKLSYFLG